MANVNHPFGFRALGFNLSGGCFQTAPFTKLANYNAAVFTGDVLKQVGSGDINIWSAGVGPSGVSLQYSPALTAATILAVADPTAVFVAQSDIGGSANLGEADRGLNATIELGTAGNASTKQSGQMIDSSSKDVTNTLELHLIDKLATPDNEYGNYCRFVCTFNVHRMLGGVVGV